MDTIDSEIKSHSILSRCRQENFKLIKRVNLLIKWDGNNVLLFGSEGHGLNQHTEKYTDFSVKISINKNIESLNISNSAAIVFHHINQQK